MTTNEIFCLEIPFGKINMIMILTFLKPFLRPFRIPPDPEPSASFKMYTNLLNWDFSPSCYQPKIPSLPLLNKSEYQTGSCAAQIHRPNPSYKFLSK